MFPNVNEAFRIAKKAVDSLKRSRATFQSTQGHYAPTWTGRSGSVGAPLRTRRQKSESQQRIQLSQAPQPQSPPQASSPPLQKRQRILLQPRRAQSPPQPQKVPQPTSSQQPLPKFGRTRSVSSSEFVPSAALLEHIRQEDETSTSTAEAVLKERSGSTSTSDYDSLTESLHLYLLSNPNCSATTEEIIHKVTDFSTYYSNTSY